MSQAPISLPVRPGQAPETITLDRLAECVRSLDPGTRALLDLSVRRRIRDDAMAPLLRTDPFHLAWRRARALERVATECGGESAAPLADVRAALSQLPGDAWLAQPQLMPAAGPTKGAELVPLSHPTEHPSRTEIVARRPRDGEHRHLLVAVGQYASSELIDQPRRAPLRGRFKAAAGRAIRVIRKRSR